MIASATILYNRLLVTNGLTNRIASHESAPTAA